jgi:hypothetical protein
MKWLEDYNDESIVDEDDKLFHHFNSFKNYLDLPKENIMFLKAQSDMIGINSACFARSLIDNINLQNDVNVVMWVCSEMTHTTERGPWTKVVYQDNEQKVLQAVRQIAEFLKMPAENVLFLVPGDEFQKDKIGEFVDNFLCKFDASKSTAMVWFKCKDIYYSRTIKRMIAA